MYYFDLDSSVETFMLSVEEKLDRQSSLKWQDRKMELKKYDEPVTIDEFIKFFTEKVRKEENVNLVRNFSKGYGENKFKPRAKIFQNKMKSPRIDKPMQRGQDSSHIMKKLVL